MPTRRAILTTGAASVLVAGVGAGGCAWYPGTASARMPWTVAGDSLGDARLDALSYAILAPNPHNRQPWWFELVDDDKVDVYADLDRLLPETDPMSRQITIGFGCMLELLRQAAAEKGFRADITPFPDGASYPDLNGNRIAQVAFVRGGSPDPLFASVPQRRTLRDVFSDRAVTAEVLTSLLAGSNDNTQISGTLESKDIDQLIDIAARGWRVEYEKPETRRESIDLMRIGNRAVSENPDGISLDGSMMGLLRMAGVLTPRKLDTPGSTAYKTGLNQYDDFIHSARGFVWITTPENKRTDQLNAGYAWVRLNLEAQRQGLGVHPLSQVLQEFPEMSALNNEIHDLLATGGQTIQMLARIGYGKFPPPAPRWPLSSRLINKGA